MQETRVAVDYDWARDVAIVRITDEKGLSKQAEFTDATLEQLIAALVDTRAGMRAKAPDAVPKKLPMTKDPNWEVRLHKEKRWPSLISGTVCSDGRRLLFLRTRRENWVKPLSTFLALQMTDVIRRSPRPRHCNYYLPG